MNDDPVTHIHISEREADGTWEDCTWDSGLEFYRDAFDPRKPATHAEAQLLRRASGEPTTGGSNMTDLRRGVKVRYGRDLPPAINAHNILTALRPGFVSITQGSMGAFGPLHRLSKWDRNFDGGHAVWLARTPDGVLLWCDPEAPTSADVPIVVSEAEVQKFVNAFAGEAIVAPALQWPPKEEQVEPIVKYLPGYTANVKPTANVRNAPRISTATKVYAVDATKDPVVLIGTVKGDPDPDAAGSTEWYLWWDAIRKMYLYTAASNIRDLKAPAVDDGYTKATQDAAVAAQKAADDVACAAAVAQATADEKERIALAMAEASADAIRQS